MAQLIIEKYTRTEIEEVTEGDLDSTERGEGGFGSTGVQQIPSKKRDQPEGVAQWKEIKRVYYAIPVWYSGIFNLLFVSLKISNMGYYKYIFYIKNDDKDKTISKDKTSTSLSPGRTASSLAWLAHSLFLFLFVSWHNRSSLGAPSDRRCHKAESTWRFHYCIKIGITWDSFRTLVQETIINLWLFPINSFQKFNALNARWGFCIHDLVTSRTLSS